MRRDAATAPRVEVEPPRAGPEYDGVKRLLDVTGALALLVLTSPLLAFAALAVALTMGRPIFYRQMRTGRQGRSFRLVKLRTMRPALGSDGTTPPDEARLTGLGRVLRTTSVDELPQLWNVVRGDMSLVGPRPLLPHYLPRYSPAQARRHEVRPGLTGLAQVNGRNALAWEEKFALDVWYVEHRSFRLDCCILWRTLLAVVRADGIAARGHASMPEFLGSETPPSGRGGHSCATS